MLSSEILLFRILKLSSRYFCSFDFLLDKKWLFDKIGSLWSKMMIIKNIEKVKIPVIINSIRIEENIPWPSNIIVIPIVVPKINIKSNKIVILMIFLNCDNSIFPKISFLLKLKFIDFIQRNKPTLVIE